MKNLRYERPRDDLRLQIAEYFGKHLDIANNLQWWGVNNYLLSNDEKIMAKYLINTYRDEQRLPDLAELSKAIRIPDKKLPDRLHFMVEAGLLKPSNEEKLGFAFADGYGRWGGPMRYNFHTVHVRNEPSFDVW